MSAPSEKTITIKIEIQIPVGAGIGTPTVSATTSETPPVIRPFGINIPIGEQDCRWGGSDGAVCAAGDAIDGQQRALQVGLKVFPGIPTGLGSVPYPDATWINVRQEDGSWGQQEIGGVTGYPNVNPHTLACWAQWPGLNYTLHDTKPFTPYWTTQTECAKKIALPPTTPPCVFELIPVAWKLKTQGFSGGPLAQANGEWSIRLVKAPGGKVLYDNCGDGVITPRIRLSCEHPLAPVWELSFERGGCRVTYARAANQFDGQCRNVFQNAVTMGLSEDAGIPAAISIVPE